MAATEKLFFADAVNGSPSYSAEEFVAFFAGFFLHNGIEGTTLSTSLHVAAQGSPGLAVDVSVGSCWLAGHRFTLTGGTKSLAVASNSSGSLRIDRVIVEVDLTASPVTATIKILQGTPGSGVPALTNNASKLQLSLAQLSRASGDTAIGSGEITDERTLAIKNFSEVGFNVVIDGGGSFLVAGSSVTVEVPYDVVLDNWTLLADQSGTVVIRPYADVYANYPPDASDDIGPPSTGLRIITATKATSSDLSGWARTTLSKGEILKCVIPSDATSITRVTLALRGTRT